MKPMGARLHAIILAALVTAGACGGSTSTPAGPSAQTASATTATQLGTPWNQLPPLSAEAKAIIRSANLDPYPTGAVKKFESPRIAVSSDDLISRSAVIE